MKNNLAESIRARLLNLSKSEGSDFSTLLTRYALERFLYRISQSEYANIFLLKGALLFALWYDMPHRPTKDIDLLGNDFAMQNQDRNMNTGFMNHLLRLEL